MNCLVGGALFESEIVRMAILQMFENNSPISYLAHCSIEALTETENEKFLDLFVFKSTFVSSTL